MKTIISPLIMTGLALLLSACNSSTPPAKKQQSSKDSLQVHATKINPHLKDDQLNALYQQYSHLTTALTDGNLSEAKIAALAIEAGTEKMKHSRTLTSSASKIAAATDIESQRQLFATLSNDFIGLLKKTGLDRGQLYIAHCPMAMNDQGALWLSNTPEIRNPYFGESMLNCGTIEETLGPALK